MLDVYTALPTPFVKGKVDLDSMKVVLDKQNASDTKGVVALGTTGENNLLSQSERLQVLQFVRRNTNKDVIAGICNPSTSECVHLAKQYQKLGADALLVTTPYYIGCNTNGLVKHYQNISKGCKLPIILYNVPRRTGFDVDVVTVVKISERCNLLAVKECNGSMEKLAKYRQNGIDILCGNDGDIGLFTQSGYNGVISVVSNICPNLTTYNSTSKTVKRLASLCATGNPSAIKYALFCAGLTQSCQVRLPLTTPTKGVKRQISEFVVRNWDGLR